MDDIASNQPAQLPHAPPVLAPDQLHMLLDQIGDVVFQTDDEGRWIYLNHAWFTLTGYPVAESLGRHYSDFISPAEQTRTGVTTGAMCAETPHLLFRLQTTYGRPCWIESHACQLFNEQGTSIGCAGTLRDVSAQYEAAENLRRRDAILAAVSFAAERFLQADDWQAAMPEVLSRLGVAAQVSRIYVYENHEDNQRLCTTKRAEWAAPGFPSLMDDPALQGLDYQASGFERWIELLSHGEIIYGYVEDFPVSEREFLTSYTIVTQIVVPIFVNQHWWGFIGYDDCIARRIWSDAEREALRTAASMLGAAIQRDHIVADLRFSKSRLYALLESSPIAIWCKDRDGRYELWCRQSSREFQLSEQQVIGKRDDELFPAEIAAGHILTDQEVWHTRQPLTFETAGFFQKQTGTYAITKFPLFDDQGLPYAIFGMAINITSRKRAEEAQRLLGETSLLLDRSLEPQEMLDSVAGLAVTGFADWCVVIALSDSRTPQHVAIACADPADQPFVERLRPYITTLDDHTLSVEVARSGCPLFIPEVSPAHIEASAHDVPHLALLHEIGPHSVIAAPLIARGQFLGTITFTLSRTNHAYTLDDLTLAEEISRRAALAVDSARLYQITRRRLAEMTTLQRVARTISSTIQLNQIFRTVVDQISAAFDYKLVSIYLREGDELKLQAYVGYETVMATIRIDQAVSGRVCRTGRASFVRNAAEDPDFIVVAPDTCQAIIIPLQTGDGNVLGTFLVESNGQPLLTDDDFTLLQLLADQISVALVNARLYQETQQALRDRNESLAVINALFASAPLGLAFLDDSLRVVRPNAALARLLNHDQDFLIGRLLGEIIPRLNTELLSPLHQVLATGTPLVNLEVAGIGNLPEQQRTFLITAYPVRLPEGQIVGLGVAATDITDRKAAEEARLSLERKLLETQKLESLGVMAGGIAHDFNNLLMAILGNAQLAMLDLAPDQPAYQHLVKLETATRHAAGLTAQMLAYAGKGRFVMELVDLNKITEEMLNLLHISLSKSASLTFNLATIPLTVFVDVTQIRQVLLNLISNAAEAIDERGGSVQLRTRHIQPTAAELADYLFIPDQPTEAYALLEISDTGCGMDAATLTRIFDPFFTTKFAGRGLGLAAVQGIVRSHQGTIKVCSAPGNGTTVTVLLPYAPHTMHAPQPAKPPSTERQAGGTVLVIDDEAEVRAVTTRLLQRLSYQVLEAANGIEGLACLNADPAAISCVLLDLTMPDLGGEEVLRHLRAHYAKVPVIVMSGYSEEEITARLAELRPYSLLLKPFTLDALRMQIKQASEQFPNEQSQ